ncbi:hypothetical protein SERLA73DRAFT_179480 [Serpula lacrymans var. lacrymans S7.3]|uniref:PCI domain-containing protein n=2 Tax=Serpula lacrymans var. lacrymans TaxID=341189 RepID=F8PSI8_SERL3|nr:uncharacterized protein SERLADRAFT_464634 [Serpula lacrymans var. lacrymans S7.9]EGO01318.1 hypothetical protein SERLA73DRAFT_179480 [Serpula lacrymans var. lacrymans S7.3]EGO26957.1 hypothetical protein SERLADRAFT_464634 [Serpula lacrymans var. lacrymans S7.9]
MPIEMEVDIPENISHGGENNAFQKGQKRPTLLPVDDAHPFDLETYISGYTGRTAVDRLLLVISTCPTIAPQALKLALTHIQQLRDPALYQSAIATYEYLASIPGVNVPPTSEIDSMRSSWMDETVKKNQAERTKLEVELKTYSNNMIKESIRMGHRDLGDFFRATGDFPMALKNYTKSREFCTTSQHVLDMCLSVLELLIEQKNYAHIPTYVFKADAALDAANAASNNAAANNPQATQATTNKKFAEREKVQSKLDLATALSCLGLANYEKAALTFLKLGSAQQLGDWLGKLVAPSDIAIYGTLCALSTLSRSAIKSQLLDNAVFSVYIEQEPYIRELIQAYMTSNFKMTLELLSRYSTRHSVDLHLAAHIQEITNCIRNVAIILYFQPFASIKLDRMSTAFGWTIEEVEKEVVALIQSGQIQGRVDSQNKILKAKKTDYRAELFARAIRAGAEMQCANRKLLLRMRLQQADIVVKSPKVPQSGHSGELLGD